MVQGLVKACSPGREGWPSRFTSGPTLLGTAQSFLGGYIWGA